MRKPMNRRMFLRGVGGAVLAIPFLPSLTSKAFAADPGPGDIGKCFLGIGTEHGGACWADMYPSATLLNQTLDYAGRTVRYGALPTTPSANGKVVFSPICSASSAVLTPALAKKFTVLKGVDVPYGCGHNYGIMWGAYADPGIGYKVANIDSRPYFTRTIDQAMAWSPGFYAEADLQNKMTRRSFAVWNSKSSWNYASPSTQTGTVIGPQAHRSSFALFKHFFKPGESLLGLDMYVVDRIKEGYDRLKKDPRLSKGDGQRLDQYLEQMFEIERMMSVAAKLPEPPPLPTQDSASSLVQHGWQETMKHQTTYCDLMNKVIVQAFQSGTSRVGVWFQGQHGPLFLGNKDVANKKVANGTRHGDVFHKGLGVEIADAIILSYLQGTFEYIMVDLAAKMDAVQMADGQTLLDHSLITFTQECGQNVHHARSLSYPVVMAGGAGGYFKTGNFVDYSNQDIVYGTDSLYSLAKDKVENPKLEFESPGLYYQQFLGNVMHAMGIPAKEWENFTEFTADGPSKSTPTKGYGMHYVEPVLAQDYAQAKLVMGDKLPVITA